MSTCKKFVVPKLGKQKKRIELNLVQNRSRTIWPFEDQVVGRFRKQIEIVFECSEISNSRGLIRLVKVVKREWGGLAGGIEIGQGRRVNLDADGDGSEHDAHRCTVSNGENHHDGRQIGECLHGIGFEELLDIMQYTY